MFWNIDVPWYIIALILIGVTSVTARALRPRKPRSDMQRAIQRLEKFEPRKSLDPAEIETLVQEIVGDEEASALKRAENQDASPRTKTKIQAAPGRRSQELEDVEALVQQILEPHTPLSSQRVERSGPVLAAPADRADRDRGNLFPFGPHAGQDSSLQPGTKVLAVCNFRSVKKGAFGIITGQAGRSYFGPSWSRYPCTFANNIRISVRSKQIQACNHSFSLEELEHSDFATIQSRHMMLKAQKMFSGPRRQIAPDGH